jgi:hypothetical protein
MVNTGSHALDSGQLAVAFVRGVVPGKWQRTWNERHPDRTIELLPTEQHTQLAPLTTGRADMAFVRLPIEDDDRLHVIPLYEEIAVVLASADHVVAAADVVSRADLAGETIHPADDGLLDSIEVVRAGVGVLVLPQSVARMAGGKGLEWREIVDEAPTRVALVWPRPGEDADPALVADLDDFVGIVRGRGAGSSRGSVESAEEREAAKKAAKKAAKAEKAKAASEKTGSGAKRSPSQHAPRRSSAAGSRGNRGGRSGRR